MKRFILIAALLGGFFSFSATEASAIVCARGVYRAGCVGPGGGVVVRRGYYGGGVYRGVYRGYRGGVYRGGIHRGYRRGVYRRW